jgi:hypothetical protein
MKVMIASPAAGGTVTTSYAHSLMSAAAALHAAGADFVHEIVDGPDIVANRNYLANAFLRQTGLSHILFIDTDMKVRREVFDHFIGAEKDMIGAIYTQRALDQDKFASLLAAGETVEKARAFAAEYNVLMEPGEHTIENNLVPVTGLGFGCVLLARRVFEAMIEKGTAGVLNSAMVRRAGLTGEAYDFFGMMPLPNGDLLSEDYSFCRRVHETGGFQVLGYVGGGVMHTGPFDYSAPYIHRLTAGSI